MNPPAIAGGGDGGAGGGGEQQGGGIQVPPPTVKISAPRKLKPGVKITVPKAFTGFTNPRYRWLRNGKKIKRATKRAYTLTRRDRGKRISCRIKLTPATGGTAIVVKTKALRIPR